MQESVVAVTTNRPTFGPEFYVFLRAYQGRIKAGADGAAAPGPPTKIGLSITTYYEQLSDFFINQLFYFEVEYELPIFIGLIYPV